jgi:hypothetical protein
MDWKMWKKLIFRMDGRADSARTKFTSEAGRRWEAELALHSGTQPQSPRLMVFFRDLDNAREPQRYTLARPGTSKVPKDALKELNEDDLRELLSRSVKM